MPLLSSRRQCVGERHTAERQGRTVVYYVLGDGHRIVAYASAGRPASDFNELAENLAEVGFRILIVEAPGIGGSTPFAAPVSLYDLADDLHAVASCDAARTGHDGATGLGHGFGSRPVRAAAARHGQFFTATVLIGPGGSGPLSDEAEAGLHACFTRSEPYTVRQRRIQETLFAESSTVPVWWRSGWNGGIARLQGQATAMTSNSHWKRAGNSSVLIVVGAEDKIAPPERVCPELSAHLGRQGGRRVEVRIIDGAGHALMPEKPIAIARTVADFCRQHVGGQ